MDLRLYESKLVNHKIFNDVKNSLSENPSGKLRNLTEIKDDVLYVWNSIENCLYSLNLKHLEEHEQDTPYQKLHLLSAPSYPVERITSSRCGAQVCVWGSRGGTVVELPARWGRGALFDSGTQTVLCKSYSLDERFLYSQVEVRKIMWHPSSLSHLLVLVSDNTIRLYCVALKNGPKLVKTYAIGPRPSSLLAGKTILDSLGDTAVDFTSAPDGTLLILRGNGDVYMMQCDLEMTGNPKLSGPLPMFPPADDNYGSDSCSIIALGSAETPLVVVATCSASLYHCLLLPNSSDKDCDTHALFVVEAVVLDISLKPDDDMQYTYPVHLIQCANNIYACAHAGGVHTISLPMLNNLAEYAAADEDDCESLLSCVISQRSSARHIIYTGEACPGVVTSRRQLVALCSDGNVLLRAVDPYDIEEELFKEMQLQNPALDKEEISLLLKEKQKMPFTKIVQQILTREVSQPILNVNKKEEPSPKECLEFLTQATLKLRSEYMSRQRQALEAISRKMNSLQSLSKQHDQWFDELQKELNDITSESTLLRQKCDLAEKYQEDLKNRCSSVIRLTRASAPTTSAEKELLAELERHKQNGERVAEQIRLVKQHAHHKAEQTRKFREEYKKKDIALGKSHSDTISSILQQQTSQITTIIEETKELKDELGIV